MGPAAVGAQLLESGVRSGMFLGLVLSTLMCKVIVASPGGELGIAVLAIASYLTVLHGAFSCFARL